jgi:DNA polymerase elongation subunit (family B)
MTSYEFQIVDILSDDVQTGDSFWEREFLITFYGKTIQGDNIVCNVKGFKPYFYIRLPDKWKIPKVRSLLKDVKSFISQKNSKSWSGNKHDITISKSHNFYGYNYDFFLQKTKTYVFAKVSFDSYGDMKKCSSAIQTFYKDNKPHILEKNQIIQKWNDNKEKLTFYDGSIHNYKEWFSQEHNCDCIANLYESKIHPILRFIHERNIESTGWVRISVSDKYKPVNEPIFNVDIQLDNISCKQINPINKNEIAGFITASFDIECDSSHGDFPNPIKDCKKLAIDIHESYFRHSLNLNDSFDFIKSTIKNWVHTGFHEGSNDIQTIYTLNGTPSDESLESFKQSLTDKFLDDFRSSKETTKSREKLINELTKKLNSLQTNNKETIQIKGDPIIQIGTVFHRYGEKNCYDRSIIVIGNDEKPDEKICDDLEGINVYPCKSEKELLLKWKDLILFHNPDFMTGYNIFGFDFEYIAKRVDFLFPCCSKCKKNGYWSSCHALCPKNQFYRLGRLMRNKASDKTSMDIPSIEKNTSQEYKTHWEKQCKVMSKQLSSSGLGDNILKYIFMDGRVVFDIQKEIQKGHSLDSYKLDNVSAHFMKSKIECIGYSIQTDISIIQTSSLGNLKQGDYITIRLITKYGNVNYNNNQKFKIEQLYTTNYNGVLTNLIFVQDKIKIKKDGLISFEWCLAKDDVSPQQIFDYHKHGGSSGRAKIAKYCIMDCELCIHLLQQLDIIPNNIGMASVSSVPLSYIFLRGQGIKVFSLVTKVCSQENTRIPSLVGFNGENNDGFEGAIVLEPTPGIYSDDPISVLDFASLYPNSIREVNASHETFICTQDDIDKNPGKYDKLLDITESNQITYDDYLYEQKGKTLHKHKSGTQTTCYFAKKPKGIVPKILETLLDQRKQTRKLIKLTNDPNKQKVLDGLQLAYKVTANSVYGSMGAKTSPICNKKIAACTTSVGRQRINDAEQGVKDWAIANGYHPPEVIYGDTDSVFVKFSRIDKDTGKLLTGKEALQYCIDCGIKSGEWITETKWKHTGSPQDLEYEKTFWPFILISKKRYLGDKFVYKSDKPTERTSMGIVMKRRDNAQIVKYVFGNVVEIIMNQKSIDKAMEWLQKTLKDIQQGKIDKSMFIITKSLRGYYKNPDGIAHKVLADRMAERNPGNKPKPNDRIPYMYIPVNENPIPNGFYKNGNPKFKKRKILQGDRIEHPDYIQEHNLEIDYKFYISNQIMNPVKQVLDLEKDPLETAELFKQFI